ncbi:MAG: NADH:flavin oxidoreductase/NADH oxidase [Lactobacillales bacterium]|nr:NADH:flavin oxidoreductase/NADH oxidase [Lactobacillales bacterium]
MTKLFEPFTIKGVTFKNRVVMPPMCQYMVETKDGIVNDWHMQHYVSRAVGGVGAIIIEMTGIEPDGQITNQDLGLWSDKQIPALKDLVEKIHTQGTKVGIQIGHAGRKAEDANPPVAPSPIPFAEDWKTPHELTLEEIEKLISKFQETVQRAITSGVDFIELHGAHGYLIHQFHSPLTNHRKDNYGKDFSLFGCDVIHAVKKVMPEDMPLVFRISAREYHPEGYGLAHILPIIKKYQEAGVDVFHVSTGGESEYAPKNLFAGYQAPFANKIKEFTNLPTIAVGLLGEPEVANAVIESNCADLVAIGRSILADPYWTLHAEYQLTDKVHSPTPYVRGFNRHFLK